MRQMQRLHSSHWKKAWHFLFFSGPLSSFSWSMPYSSSKMIVDACGKFILSWADILWGKWTWQFNTDVWNVNISIMSFCEKMSSSRSLLLHLHNIISHDRFFHFRFVEVRFWLSATQDCKILMTPAPFLFLWDYFAYILKLWSNDPIQQMYTHVRIYFVWSHNEKYILILCLYLIRVHGIAESLKFFISLISIKYCLVL